DAVAIFRLDNQVAAAVKAVTARIEPAPAVAARRAQPVASPAQARRPSSSPSSSSSFVAPSDGDWQEF
ncbi:MAG: hypothetical protein ACN6RJ_06625, partial [Stenotrophomonas sp.]